MSGHNKWSSIKHHKAAQDAKRSKVFTKIIRELTVAAREGGSDPDHNPRLRTAMAAAKAASMPGDNVDRAIKRGAGELNDGAAFEEFNFEGYAPGGVALVIQCLSDNRNRTTADVRHLLTRYNGKLGTTGSVLHQFARKGVIAVSGEKANEDALMEIVLEAKGFEDMKVEEEGAVIYTDPAAVSDVQEALEKAGVKVDSLEVGLIPSLMVKVDGKTAEQVLKLIDLLEELDDVQHVYGNHEIDDAEMERIAKMEG